VSFRLAGLLFLACAVVVGAIGLQAIGADTHEVRDLRLGAPHGLRQYVSDTWGVVAVDVRNVGDQPAEVLASFFHSHNSAEQYARKIWTPPHSLRRTWVPIRIPRLPAGKKRVDFAGLLIDSGSGSDVVMRRKGEVLRRPVTLFVRHEKPMAGFISMPRRQLVPEGVDYAYEALIALQSAKGMERLLAIIGDRYLPTLPEAYDGLDLLLIYNNRFAEDVAAMSAIRAWLNDGGHLWIMLDAVEFDGIERLLGEAFACQMVDRVELNNVQIRNTSSIPTAADSSAVQHDEPVDLVRVIVSDMEVTHTVNGWPAAFVRNVGRGKVVFTTLDARAWVKRPGARAGRWDPRRSTDFAPIEQLEELPTLVGRRRMSLEPRTVVPHLSEQIGYRIVSRTRVFAILAAFCIGLTVVGICLARVRRLEHLGWIAPVAALAAAAPLVWFGVRAQQTVPPTIGQMQFVEVADLADRTTTTGIMALYHPASVTASLGAREGGLLMPDAMGAQDTTRRMVWTDLDQWHWENLRLPAGVRIMSFRHSATLTEPVEAVGTFTSAGFEGRLTGTLESPGDAVIAIPGQPLLAAEIERGVVKVTSENLLVPGNFIAGALLSDEQRRRQSTYRHLLREERSGKDLITRPTLFTWTNPTDTGFQLPKDVRQVGSALWAVPLKIERAKRGAQLVIPSPFVQYRTVRGPKREGVSPLYDHRTGEWIYSKTDSRTWLRFQVPQAILPVTLNQARLTLDIEAPSRTLEILGVADGQYETVFTKSNPIGRIEVDIANPSLLKVDETGGFMLGLLVSDPNGVPKRQHKSRWEIKSLQLEVAGRAL